MMHKLCITMVAVTVLINIIASKSAAQKFWPTGSNTPKLEGSTVIIRHLADLSNMANKTVPSILRSSSDPFTFINDPKRNTTLDKSSRELLSLIGRPINHVKRRSVNVHPCPITWFVEFHATRYPNHIWKAACNGVGTTCIAPGTSQPGCQEIKVTYAVLYFRGITTDGSLVWQWKYENFPVSCVC